jgi:hypothetical protein
VVSLHTGLATPYIRHANVIQQLALVSPSPSRSLKLASSIL